MTLRAIAAVLVACLLPAPRAAAQTPAPGAFIDPGGLSLDSAIERALAQEPSMRAARTDVDAARGMRQQAGLRGNPSVSVELRDEPAGMDRQTEVSVEWPLELFRRAGRRAVADREVTATALAVADRERLLAAEVRARIGEVLVAVRDLGILDELAAATRRQHELLQARVEQGAAPPLERDTVDVELRRLDAERLLQAARAERAMFEVKRLLGAPPDEPLRLRDSLEAMVAADTKPAPLPVDAAQQRSDVREAAARVDVADARIDRARREGRADVSLFAGYMRMDAGFPQLAQSPSGMLEPINGRFHYLAGGVMVTVPIFNRNQGEVAAAQAERAGAAARQDAAALTARTEIAIARAADERARQAVQLYAAGGSAVARRNLAVVQESYALGRSTVFDVLAEQKRYLDLERSYTEALSAAYEARTALIRAAGDMQ